MLDFLHLDWEFYDFGEPVCGRLDEIVGFGLEGYTHNSYLGF